MDGQLIITILSLILGISGWVTLFYNHITHKPKIKGRIFDPVVGNYQITQDGKSKNYTTYLTYLYLVTNRKTPVRVLDYDMVITFKDGTSHKLERFYGSMIENFTFSLVNNEKIDPKLSENLIYKKHAPVDQKEPLHGFVLFGGNEDLYTKEISKMEVIITDVFGNTHVISESDLDKKINISLLSDLAGFDLPFHFIKSSNFSNTDNE
ncbi:hypothetical protein ACIQX3_21480 [Peribacillus frigoritolerans]|uniref:hypothetical protein n=1 Tax=Peribacillus frigoritolerans TaxID=450367 RepID=UPI00380224CD